MKYVIQFPDGPSHGYTIEEIRKEYRAGKLRDDCQVRQSGNEQWMTLRELLVSTGDLSPGTPEEIAAIPAHGGPGVSKSASARYRDAYTVARAVNGVGGLIKVFGIIIGCGFAVVGFGLGATSHNDIFIYGGVAFGVVGGIPIFVLGILVSAAGQQTKACLDAAVHTSPFLTDAQKASVMSLK